MTLYNALPRKEYERVLCKTATKVCNTVIVTHQDNLQVNYCKIDLPTHQYEKFLILSEENIDSGFTQLFAIVISLISLDQDYSSKNHVRKASKTTKENVKSLALKAKFIREQTIDDSDSKKRKGAGNRFGNKGAESSRQKRECYNYGKKDTLLVNARSPRRTMLLSEELEAIVKMTMNHKRMQLVSWRLTHKGFSLNVIYD
uniref:UBN2 domain-containing protein n=1 Tax=Tanacetum cinerariifolium TaxID=118510 RepID=A0A6L2JQ83_TANCI|nr:UBN2 domain-containing protein [Tanacetum cinerariifolium]